MTEAQRRAEQKYRANRALNEKRVDVWFSKEAYSHLSLLMARHKTNAPETIRIVLKEAVEKDND